MRRAGILILALVVLLALVVGLYWLVTMSLPAGEPGVTQEPTDGGEVTNEPMCPQATPELFTVQPLTSPTNLLTQTVEVSLGNSEMITITTESGVFTAPDGPITIDLLPNTIHHLQVTGRVRVITGSIPGCTYGGYTLSAERDVNGDLLVIIQQSE